MKTNVKKNVLLVALSFFFAISMFLFAGITPVKAEVGTSVGTTFQMMEAVQVRCNTDGNGAGLRFRVEMDYQTASYVKANENVTMGFIITPKAIFDARADETVEEGATPSYTADQYIYSISQYVNKYDEENVFQGGIIVDEEFIYIADPNGDPIAWEGEEDQAGEGQSYYANAAVVDILEANRALDFTAVAYIKVVDGETESYTYAVPSDEFSRNVYATSSKIYWDQEDARELIENAFSWYATKSYPVQITDKAEYDAFALGTATDTFEGDYIQVASPIDLGVGDGSEVNKVASTFAGTLAFAKNTTLVYENTAVEGQAPVLAEEGCAIADLLANTVEVYDASKLNLKPADMSVYYKWQEINDYNTKTATYISKADVEAVNEANGIVDNIAWDKDLDDSFIKYSMYNASTNNYYQRVEMPYTRGAYQVFYENGKFDAVSFQYMIQTDASVTSISNRNAGYETLMSAIGYYSSSWIGDPELLVPTNTWMSGVAEADQFITAIKDNNLLTIFRSYCNNEFTFYLSELKFIDYDWDNHVEWSGTQNFVPSASTKVTFSSGSYTVTYMTNAEVLAEVEVVNPEAYDGDVVKVSAVPHNRYLYPYVPYTNTQYEKLYKNGTISKVRMTYMVTSSDGAVGYCYDTSCFIGKYATPEYSIAKWITLEFDLTDEMSWAVDDGLFRYATRIYYMRTKAVGSSRTFDIYIGNIEFI